jgi:hypothetical protein
MPHKTGLRGHIKSCEALPQQHFIEMVWNNNRLDLLNQYLHPAFRDYSQPFFAVQNVDGFRLYLREINKYFMHRTDIVEIVQDGCVVTARIRLELRVKNPATFQTESETPLLIEGFRTFTMLDHQVFDHREQLEITTLSVDVA